MIGKKTRGLGNKRTNGDNPNYSMAEISQNTEKCTKDFGRRCQSDSSERPSANADVKNFQGVKIIIIKYV